MITTQAAVQFKARSKPAIPINHATKTSGIQVRAGQKVIPVFKGSSTE